MNADGSGTPTRLTTDPAVDYSPSFSPDGSRIVFHSTRGGVTAIYVMNADGSGQPTRLTNDSDDDITPAFSPDGSKIVFISLRDGNREIYLMDADGRNQTPLTTNSAVEADPCFTPDGSKIVFGSDRDGDGEIYVMSLDRSYLKQLTFNTADDGAAAVSPDGSQIAFMSNRSGGKYQVYVMDSNGDGQVPKTTVGNENAYPSWGGTLDTTFPTVTLNRASGQSSSTSASPINFTVVFSKPVSDFTTGDVSLTGSTAPGALVATVTGSGTTYNVAVNGMTGSGTVIASIAAGVAHDAEGNPNLASATADNSVTYFVPNQPPTDIALSNSSVAENLPSGSAIGTVSGSDPNHGQSATLVFSLISGYGDNSLFVIDPATKQLKTASMFDYEARNSYNIKLRATDSGSPALTHDEAFTIYVTNVNEKPTDITLSSTTVPENLPAGTTVGTLGTTDPDSGNTFTYTPVSGTGGTDNAWFTISGNSLKTVVGFDYETKNSYSIRVLSTDQDGRSTEKTFTIYVTNGNEPPTLAPISNPAAILEDAPRQTVNLAGITAGSGESQALLVTATSSDPWLIPNPVVSYSSPKNIGSLSYTPVVNQSGTATITVTVRDAGFDGTLGNADDGLLWRTFTVTVNPLNDLPTLDVIANRAAIFEDAGTQIVYLTGITTGGGESQTLQVTATSSNPGLIPNPTINYNSANTTGSLSYTPVANQSGTATITVTVRDAGLDGTLGTADDATFLRTFTVTVMAVNDPPTLDAIADPAAILEDAAAQTLNLTGITAGSGEAQRLQVTATSNNPGLIPNPTVSYASPGGTGILTYKPVANRSGSATITVIVRDAGLDGRLGNADDATLARTFTVTVLPVNDVPTLNAISNPAAIKEDVGLQTVKLSGISAGAGELQALQVTATSSNPGLIANPTVNYSSPNSTGIVSYTPVANQSGTATITLTVRDAGLDGILGSDDDATFSRTFTVTVVPVNDLPTLDVIVNPAAIIEDAGTQMLSLTGISAGGGESQTLQVTATSNNSKLIPNPAISYSSADGTGSLSYTPVVNQSGTARITVAVRDAGLDGKLGSRDDALFSRTFTVTVIPINDLPTLNAIADTAPILEGASRQTVNLAGISAGGGESQRLQVTATSSDPWLIPNPTVSYFSARSTGSLSYTPVANQSGSASVTVTVQDAGLDGRLGSVDDATFLRTFAVTVLPKGASLKLATATSISTSAGGAEMLSQTDLRPTAEAAVALWSNAGLPKDLIQRLRQVHFVIADLPGSELGRATSDAIYIDTNAAGNSWFIDGSPLENEEFAPIAAGSQLKAVDRLAMERVDLLTVVCHELGHVAGLDDLTMSSDGIMGDSLPNGTRRIVRRAEVDAVFARGRLFG